MADNGVPKRPDASGYLRPWTMHSIPGTREYGELVHDPAAAEQRDRVLELIAGMSEAVARLRDVTHLNRDTEAGGAVRIAKDQVDALLDALAKSPRGGGDKTSMIVGGGGGGYMQDVKRGVTDFESRLDYAARTDDQPVYVGRALQGTATSAGGWVIEKLTYDASNRAVRKEVATGVWDNRVSMFGGA